MKKKALSIILVVSILLGVVPFSAHAVTPEYISNGEYVYSIKADNSTYVDKPTGFGTSASNGRVWTDKSVKVNKDNFEVALSALSQEYVQTAEIGTGSKSTPADVLIVLDFSQSMYSNSMPDKIDGFTVTRAYAMTKALNEALEIIMHANENNRVLVFGFHSQNTYSKLFDFNHYINPTWDSNHTDGATWSATSASNASGKYVDFTIVKGSRSSSFKLTTSSTLKKGNDPQNSPTYSQKSITEGTYTPTQGAMAYSIKNFISAINNETNTNGSTRKPFVLLMTDGDPTVMYSNWWYETPPTNEKSNSSTYGTVTTSQKDQNNQYVGTPEMAATAVLTTALWIDKLSAAYTSYNGKDTKTLLYNIGLGKESDYTDVIKCVLDPTFIKDTSTIKAKLDTNAAKYSTTDYSIEANYDKAFYSEYCTAYQDLSNAFEKFSKDVEASSAAIFYPIISSEGSGASSDLEFTDIIGSEMTVSGIELVTYDTENKKTVNVKGVKNSTIKDKDVYEFEGYTTTATVTKSGTQETLVWDVPLEEVPIFSFADRSNLDNDDYISALPIRLTYTVSVATKESLDGDKLYSNAFSGSSGQTTVTYSVAEDNPYYFNVTNDSKNVFVESSIKSAPSPIAKTSNITETATYSTSNNYLSVAKTEDHASYANITETLGNNGLLYPIFRITKSASTTSPAAGDTVTYTVNVKNYTTSEIKNLKVNDVLPKEMTAVGATTQTVSIPASSSKDITFTAMVNDDVVAGTDLINTANISEINGTVLTDKPETTCKVTTVEGKFGVTYSWTGNIPASATLPEDSRTYKVGTAYDVDEIYFANYKVETKDAYNNVTERWVFSGWSTPNNGLMKKDGVTLEGNWTYSTVIVPKNKVVYDWGSVLPQNAVIKDSTEKPVLPINNTEYVPGQQYTVDSTYTSKTSADVKDDYGNVIEQYTFSGWTDPNGGVMDKDGVTVTGSWTKTTIPLTEYCVTYDWSKGDSVPSSKAVFQSNPTISVSLPSTSETYVKNEPFGDDVDVTYRSGFVAVEYDAYGNVTDTWTFSGWTVPNNGNMPEGGATVTGSWEHKKEPVPSGKVNYQYTGTIPDAYNGNEPTDEATYVKGQGYELKPVPTTEKVPHYTQYGNIDGYYTFEGWSDPNKGIMDEHGVTVTGNWSYESVPVCKYGITYSWEAYDENNLKVLVPADCGLIPSDIAEAYEKNEPFKSAIDKMYTSSSKVDTYDAYNNITGTWSFSGWEIIPADDNMPEGGVSLKGKWTYVTQNVDTYSVVYQWTSAPDNGAVLESNESVMVSLPIDPAEYVKSQTYTENSTYLSGTKAIKKDTYGNITDKWTFSGWTDTNSTPGVMDDDGAIIIGSWNHETVPVPSGNVIYKFTGNVPEAYNGKEPTDPTTYVNGQGYELKDVPTTEKVPHYTHYGNIDGYYTFEGWSDPNIGVMDKDGVEVTGNWKYDDETVAKYGFKYSWKAYDENNQEVSVPSVCGSKPANSAVKYEKNEPFKSDVDVSFTSATEVKLYDTYNNLKGTWKFSGWTLPSDDKMPENGITIPGEWHYTTETIPSGQVTYKFTGSVPEIYKGKEPTDPTTYVNGQGYELKDVPTTEKVPHYTKYGNIDGYYTFEGWSDPNNGVMDKDGVEVTGNWKYDDETVAKYGFKYSWKAYDENNQEVSVPSVCGSKPADSAVKYEKNEPFKSDVDASFTSATKFNVYDTYNNLKGTWKFSGWTLPSDDKMPENGITIPGEWHYTTETIPSGQVTYKFTGSVPETYKGKEPTDPTTYVNGQGYELKDVPTTEKVPHYTQYGNIDGYYTFEGWSDPNNGVMDKDGVEVTGNWKYNDETVAKYGFKYSWKAYDENNQEVSVPSVCGTKPADSAVKYEKNEPFKSDVDVSFTSATEVKLYDTYNNLKGTWKFSGWTLPTDDKMPENGITIPGEWHYTAETIPTGQVTYEFLGKGPANVNPPVDENSYVPNQPYTLKENPVDVPTYDEYGNQNGTWKFDGWNDPNNGKMVEGGSKVTGTWTLTPNNVPQYDVTYKWSGDVPTNVVLPTDSGKYVKNQPYEKDVSFTDGYVVEVKDQYNNITGKYTFSGWTDPGNGKMLENGVEITGTWKFETVEVKPGKVTYVFTGNVPEGVLPPIDENTYVPGQPYSLKDKPEPVIIKDEYDNVIGIYTFDGWEDPNNGKMTEGGSAITGRWTFTPQDPPKHIVDWPIDPHDPEKGKEQIEIINGAFIIVDPNAGLWDHSGSTYDKATNVKIVEDLSIEDPTRDNYTFTGWTITSEGGLTKYIANWELNDRNVKFTPDPENEDPSGNIIVPKGTVITIDPNGGKWNYKGKVNTSKTQITITDDTVIEDPTRDGYEFTGWKEIVDDDGNITLEAQWKKTCNIDPWLIAVIGGGIVAGAIAAGVTTGIVIGCIAAVPVVIIGAKHIHNAIEENNTEQTDENEPTEIPDTGSYDNSGIFAVMALASASAAVVFTRKKRKEDEEY